MHLPDFRTRDADGYVHVTGHRIRLFDIVHFYNEGYTPEALVDNFPTLSLAVIHKVIASYLENAANVDSAMQDEHAKIERQRAAAHGSLTLEELRRRMSARSLAETP